MIQQKKASVLLYTIVLTSIALILAFVVLNNYSSLILNQQSVEIEKAFYNNIKNQVTLFSETTQEVNNDGSGFIDMLSGSGSNIYCRLQLDGSYLMQGDDGVKSGEDGFDDNCNSDNYNGNNTGSLAYPNDYEDNDNYMRKHLEGFVTPGNQKGIFWNNYKIENYINKNPNNVDVFNEKLGDVNTGYLHLDINQDAKITLIKINKNRYTSFNEFEKVETLEGNVTAGSGYIKNNAGNIELNSSQTGAYEFNFNIHDYVVFLTNLNTSEVLYYSLYGKTNNNKGVYLNPIDDTDSNSTSFKVLGYDIIMSRGRIMGKMIEMVGKK